MTREATLDCASTVGLLQPFVDGELTNDEDELVAHHVEDCQACRKLVSQQHLVRATLRCLTHERAPQAVYARIVVALDAIDAGECNPPLPANPLLPADRALPAETTRPRAWLDFLRGGMVMLPAAAVALIMFFVARHSQPPVATSVSAALSSQQNHRDDREVVHALAGLESSLDFPVQVADHQPTAPVDIALVGAELEGSGRFAPPVAALEYAVPTGDRVLDRQRNARGAAPFGTPYVFRGRTYIVTHDAGGEATVRFELEGVAHTLSLSDDARVANTANRRDGRELAILLEVADALARRPNPSKP